MVTVAALPPPDKSDKGTAVPAVVPPAGLNVAWADLPRKLFILIVPEATPAKVRTAVSFKLIEAVEVRPSSTLTWDIDIVPVGSAMYYLLIMVLLEGKLGQPKVVDLLQHLLLG
jgi:hypothetical protein